MRVCVYLIYVYMCARMFDSIRKKGEVGVSIRKNEQTRHRRVVGGGLESGVT